MNALRTRLVVGTTFLVAVAGGAISGFAWKVAEAAQRRDVDQILRDKATILGRSLNRQNPREVYPIRGEMQREELQYFGQGFDTNRMLLWKSDALPMEVPLTQLTGGRDSLMGLAGRLLATNLLATLLAALTSYVLTSRWLSAMGRLAEATRQYGDGFQSPGRIPIPSGDPEVAALSQAFNDMLDRMDRAIANQR